MAHLQAANHLSGLIQGSWKQSFRPPKPEKWFVSLVKQPHVDRKQAKCKQCFTYESEYMKFHIYEPQCLTMF